MCSFIILCEYEIMVHPGAQACLKHSIANLKLVATQMLELCINILKEIPAVFGVHT